MASADAAPPPAPSLDDRYLVENGRVLLTGIQALVRLPIDQARRDGAAGRRIGTFISGYPGSPLAAYDRSLQAASTITGRFGIVHQPGQNEELASTAVTGTQLLDLYPHERYDGVVGIWYGKGPGMDRSLDAMRHGNYMGTSARGAVVVLSGEDHEAVSSTLPIQQEYAFAHCGIPLLYPSSVQEILELGLHAVAMSRHSGCWVGLKLVTQLCDSAQVCEVSPDAPVPVIPEPEDPAQRSGRAQYFRFLPGETVANERALYTQRHPAALAYVAANRLNEAVLTSSSDRVAVVAAGKSWADLRHALADMSVDDAALSHAGVRLVKLACLYPADLSFLRSALLGLEEVIVIEEKRGFLEEQVCAALAGLPGAPRVHGKRDREGREWFPAWGGLDADAITRLLGPRLAELLPGPTRISARIEEITAARERRHELLPLRLPNYCSGCPHNFSTRLLPGQTAWSAPGCHVFATVIDQPERHTDVVTQYGGDGLAWIGLAPFTDRQHMIVNTGDGSLFHSSYQNIRFAIAAGVTMTFKILYNGAIANTGAQKPVGQIEVPRLARLLALEGVAKMAIVAKDPHVYRGVRWPSNCRLEGPEGYEALMTDLERTAGVTVFLYDGECSNERRRKQRRGLAPRPSRYLVINEDVCESCGDCGRAANCMSLQSVATEFGPKTRIQQSSCNQDHLCVTGDCPSFMTVDAKPGSGRVRRTPPELDADAVPDVARPSCLEPYRIHITGVGGTGVLTLNAILSWAGTLEGRRIASYDQTGAAQKWGAVVSSIAIWERGPAASSRVGCAQADLYLALDLMAGSDARNLERCGPGRTAAVLNTTLLPDGRTIRDPRVQPPRDAFVRAIEACTDPGRTVTVEAGLLADTLFDDHMTTNLIALGSAYQAGLLPIGADALEAAIRLNGVAVERNVQAFRYGRLARHDPARVAELSAAPPTPLPAGRLERAADLWRRHPALSGLVDRVKGLDDATRSLLRIRGGDLIDYQSPRYATSYVTFVLSCAERERARLGEASDLALTREVARSLHKLMAYKDEYEVARLHHRARARVRAGSGLEAPAAIGYLLHPPLLRAMGLRRKVRLGGWFDPAFTALHALRRVRGTWADIFRWPEVRRIERELPGWYRATVAQVLEVLTPENREIALQVAGLPDMIRGYEQIKVASATRARQQGATLLARLTG